MKMREPWSLLGGGRGSRYAPSVADELPKLIRTREDLINTHLSDDDIVMILTRLKEQALAGEWQAAQMLLKFKYGSNPEPIQTDRTLEDLLAETPLGVIPGPDSI